MVKTKVLMMVALFAGLAAIDSPSFAHHGNAAFDLGTPTVLKGAVITEFLWINPHPLIKADYKDEKGKSSTGLWKWAVRCRLSSSAGARTTLAPGDVVTLYVWKAKTGAHGGRFNKVDFADGTTMRDTQTRRRRRRASRHGRAPVVLDRAASQPPRCQFMRAARRRRIDLPTFAQRAPTRWTWRRGSAEPGCVNRDVRLQRRDIVRAPPVGPRHHPRIRKLHAQARDVAGSWNTRH